MLVGDTSGDLPCLMSLGQRLHSMGAREAALRAFEQAAERYPDGADVWNAVATLRFELGLTQGALVACTKALKAAPGDAPTLFNTAVVLESIRDTSAALHCYERVLSQAPDHLGALLNYGPALARVGRVEDAIVACQMAIDEQPKVADCHFNLGDVLLGASNFSGALDAFNHALELHPAHAKAEFSAGVALAALGEVELARGHMEKSLTLQPDLLSVFQSPLASDRVSNYPELTPERIAVLAGYDRIRACDWRDFEGFVELLEQLIAGANGHPLNNPDFPYISLGLPVTNELRRALARQVSQRIAAPLPKTRFVRPRRASGGKLRIGYLSGDLRVHAVSHLLGGLFERHDRKRFQVFVYSTGPDDGSPERKRAAAGADVLRDLSSFSGVVIGQAIAMDGVDILVDLSGYTLYGHPEALALRPAPIQVSYLGFMGTQGAPWIDYTILDHTVLLPEHRQWWDEKIAYLPTYYAPSEMPLVAGADLRRQDVGLADDAFVVCALHMPRKVDPASFRLWLRVLEEIPRAVLWLVAESPQVEAHLGAFAEALGVARQRLFFAPIASREIQLARYRLADVFLDSISYNGHASTTDALAMGLPVVTITGNSVVTRVSEAMLKSCGLSALVASGEDDFIATAVRLAQDAAWRCWVHTTLAQTKMHALFDIETRVREIEQAYEMMWSRHCAGLPPTDFDVTPMAG